MNDMTKIKEVSGIEMVSNDNFEEKPDFDISLIDETYEFIKVDLDKSNNFLEELIPLLTSKFILGNELYIAMPGKFLTENLQLVLSAFTFNALKISYNVFIEQYNNKYNITEEEIEKAEEEIN